MEDRASRRALGEFATGVTVVTARGKGEDLVGMTMSSFNSVSVDPPLVLFSVDRKALSLSAMPLVFFRGSCRDLVDEA